MKMQNVYGVILMLVLTLITQLSFGAASSTFVDFSIGDDVVIDTQAPGQVYNLDFYDRGYSWIKWGWTNPTDSDFSYSMIYIDGVYQEDVTGTQFYLGSLDDDTSYEIEIKTVDTIGNINENSVKDSARTKDRDDDDDDDDDDGETIVSSRLSHFTPSSFSKNYNSDLITLNNEYLPEPFNFQKFYLLVIFLAFGVSMLLFSILLLVYDRD